MTSMACRHARREKGVYNAWPPGRHHVVMRRRVPGARPCGLAHLGSYNVRRIGLCMPSTLQKIFSTKMLVTYCMGFASGLPLLLTKSTLQAWMTDARVNLTVIGFFALVAIPYS